MSKKFLAAVILVTFFFPAGINAQTLQLPDFKFTARSYILVDEDSGEILADKSADEVMPMASLTKLMTALVVLESKIDWNKKIKVQKADVALDKTIMPGEEVTTSTLLALSLIPSSNNATNALVRAAGFNTKDFVAKMNKKAIDFDLTATHFVEPTGIDPHNVSTARDVAQLSRIALANKQIRDIASRPELNWTGTGTKGKKFVRLVKNTNRLLDDSVTSHPTYRIIGSKTGHIEEGGYSLMVFAQSKNRRRLIAVVLGATNHFARFQEVDELLEWAARMLKPLSHIAINYRFEFVRIQNDILRAKVRC